MSEPEVHRDRRFRCMPGFLHMVRSRGRLLADGFLTGRFLRGGIVGRSFLDHCFLERGLVTARRLVCRWNGGGIDRRRVNTGRSLLATFG